MVYDALDARCLTISGAQEAKATTLVSAGNGERRRRELLERNYRNEIRVNDKLMALYE